MRWRVKAGPSIDEPYERRRFAWSPVRIGDMWVWMEPYIERGSWQRGIDYFAGSSWMYRHPQERVVA